MSTSSNAAKYSSGSPLVSFFIRRFLHALAREAGQTPVSTIVDLGCGEGFVAEKLWQLLPGPVEYLGIDREPGAIADAKARVPGGEFRVGDLREEKPQRDWADLLLMVEVLEHLADPAPALDAIAAWNPRRALISVPWEPFFRAGNFLRGRHWARLGNHPEHWQQFSPRSFEALLRRRFPNVRVQTCFPWLLASVTLRGGKP